MKKTVDLIIQDMFYEKKLYPDGEFKTIRLHVVVKNVGSEAITPSMGKIEVGAWKLNKSLDFKLLPPGCQKLGTYPKVGETAEVVWDNIPFDALDCVAVVNVPTAKFPRGQVNEYSLSVLHKDSVVKNNAFGLPGPKGFGINP